MATELPVLAAARTLMSSTKANRSRKEDDTESVAVNTLCKQLNATTMKLLYSFQALQAESDGASEAKTSLAVALRASTREELSTKIVEALAASVEKVLRCNDASMRSHVLRDIRARFAPPPEKPKPEMIDEAVQAVVRKPKISLLAAVKLAAVDSSPVRVAAPAAAPSATDDEILRQLQAGDEKAEAATKSLLAQSEASPPSAAKPAAAASAPSSADPARVSSDTAGFQRALASSAKSFANVSKLLTEQDGSKGNRSRPVSAATGESALPLTGKTTLPGIYERQLKWAAKAAEKKERLRVEKENKEREAEKPDQKKSERWAHVESVMRKQRIASEESWKSEWNEQMAAERDRRDRAEQKARDEVQARVKITTERDAALSKRKEAEERMDKYHDRMLRAETKYAEAKKAQEELVKQHSEVIEIRDPFGEGGLESWPMFPGRKVHRVLDSDEFDGRVSQEFRVKDAETGERGVTFLMGRLAGGKLSECQAVLFESKHMTDLDAARWFARNSHRFEQTRERIEREKQRAGSRAATSEGRSRSDSIKSQ